MAYDGFNRGRIRAGAGWYSPGASPWLTIAAPIGQGVLRAIPQAYGAYKAQSLTDQLNNAGQLQTPEVFGSQNMPPGTVAGNAGAGADILRTGQPPGPMSESPFWEVAPGEAGRAVPTSPTVPPGQPATADMPRGQGLTQRQQQQLMRLRLLQQLGIMSSRALKDDITRADETRSLREVMETPVYTYKYRDEGPEVPQRIGPMAEEVPSTWQVDINGRAGIKMPVYLGALHAAVRALGRDVRSLKDQIRG